MPNDQPEHDIRRSIMRVEWSEILVPIGYILYAHTGPDGAVDVSIDTRKEQAPLGHDLEGRPYLRVWVNDELLHDRSPATPLPGSEWDTAERPRR